MIESLLQSIRHITGMCGESHPSILLGGIGLMSYCIGLIRQLKEKMLKKSLHASHGSEMEMVDYSEEDLLDQHSERPAIPYLPGRYEENEKS